MSDKFLFKYCEHRTEFFSHKSWLFKTCDAFVALQSIGVIVKVKVKRSRYRPGLAQRVGRGIALLFNHRGIRRGWVVSSTPRLHFTPGKDPAPILQEAGWAPGPVCKAGKSCLHWNSIPDRPALSQSLYRLSYPVHTRVIVLFINFSSI